MGSSENDLEQATKGMMIISIVFSLLSNVLSVVLGINKLARRKGYIYSSITHFLTGNLSYYRIIKKIKGTLLTNINNLLINLVSKIITAILIRRILSFNN